MICYSDLLGCEFKYGGRSKDEGFDCYGLAIEIYKRLGITLPDFGTAFQAHEQDKLVICGQKSFVKLEKPEPYCIVCLVIRPPYVSHVGIVLPDLNKFLHTMHKIKVCVERLNSPQWNHRIRGFYKWQN